MGLIPDSTIAALRNVTNATMTSRCRITRRSTAARTYNPTTRSYTEPTPTVVYQGPCRIHHDGGGSNDTIAAGEQLALAQYGLTLPAGTDDVLEGDIVEMTAGCDEQLLDRPLYVIRVRWSTEHVHRRLILEDRQA